jgi:hypothetical protein
MPISLMLAAQSSISCGTRVMSVIASSQLKTRPASSENHGGAIVIPRRP